MIGCTLYVRKGNSCALVKNWHQGYLLSDWIHTVDLSSFSSPELFCRAFLDAKCKDFFDSLLVKQRIVLKFECARHDDSIYDLSSMMEKADECMALDEYFWRDYLCDFSDHLWYIDLDGGKAMKRTSSPLSPDKLHLKEI